MINKKNFKFKNIIYSINTYTINDFSIDYRQDINVIKSIKKRAELNRAKNESQISDRIFSQENGETEFEKHLAKKLRDTFSNYITYINPHKEKGQELCDVLVIFEDNILIFSDKGTIKFNNISCGKNNKTEQQWENYYKSIKKSNGQLLNTKNWILQNIKNKKLSFFLDKKCDKSIEIIFSKSPTFFLINTLSGLKEFAKEHYKNDGSLPIDNTDKQNNKKFMSLFVKQDDNDFYHILDTTSLEIVLDYTDTVVDFINYLKYRKEFFLQNKPTIIKREDQILFLYFIEDSKVNKYNYIELNLDKNITIEDFVQKNDNLYKELSKFEIHSNRIKYGKNSKLVDDLIDNFAYQGLYSHSQKSLNEKEDLRKNNFYALISLNRRERIALALDIEDVLYKAKKTTNESSQLSQTEFNGNIFIVCAFYRRKNETVNDYSNRRKGSLQNSFNKLLKKVYNKKLVVLYLDNPRCELTDSEGIVAFRPINLNEDESFVKALKLFSDSKDDQKYKKSEKDKLLKEILKNREKK